MKTFLVLCVALCLASFASAQEEGFEKPTPAALKYTAYRNHMTEPPYGLKKVKRLIQGIKEDSESNMRLTDRQYAGLTFEEKFTYAMIHGEDFSQNCAVMPMLNDAMKRIFAHPPGAFGDEAVWSDRQSGFMKQNRSKVLSLLRDTMRLRQRAGVNIKQAIVDLGAHELIPDLIRVYSHDKRDKDILSVLMVLMDAGKYRPFLATDLHGKLFGENLDWQASVMATRANEDLILTLSKQYAKRR